MFFLIWTFSTEAVFRRCSAKNVVIKISENLLENTCARVSFLIKLQAEACNFIKKEAPAQVLPYELCEIFKSIFFYKTLSVAASIFRCGIFKGNIRTHWIKPWLNRNKDFQDSLEKKWQSWIDLLCSKRFVALCSLPSYGSFCKVLYIALAPWKHVKWK